VSGAWRSCKKACGVCESDGYTALLAGLKRAEEIAAEGVEWGPELVEKWRDVVENYVDSYGVLME
jgi:hypothetical protein